MIGRGIPQHMDDTSKIVIADQRRARRRQGGDGAEKVELGAMNMFTQKVSGVVGPAYIGTFLLGAISGLAHVPPPRARRSTKLLISNYVDNVSKNASRYANNTGAAIFLFLMTGKFINFVFLEEFEDFGANETAKTAIFGAATGALYKSTRGRRPMMLGAFLGATIGSVYTHAFQKGWLTVPV